MILYINTANNQELEISLKNGEEVLLSQKIAVERTQAEKLLSAVEQILKKAEIKLTQIESIEVQNAGSSFTSLRVGVATANALGFALGIPVRGTVGVVKKVGDISIVEPVYDREVKIG